MRAFNKFWIPSLAPLFISAVVCFSQGSSSSVEESAIRLLAGLSREPLYNQNARTAILRWYCGKGKYAEAAEQTATLELNDRLSFLAYIAKTAAERKDELAATKVLTTAWSALSGADDDVDTVWAEQLAEVAARNQNFDLAAKFAGRLDDGSLRKSSVLLTIARSYDDLKNKKEVIASVQSALGQIEGFGEEERRDEFLIKISAARVLATIGDLDKANALAGEVQTALLLASEARAEDKTGLATLFADLGDLPRAIAIVETMIGDEKAGALMSLSQHCKVDTIQRSLLDRATEQVLNDSNEDHATSRYISDLVPVFLRAGRIDDAVELLHRIKDPYYLNRAAIAVANVLAEQRKIDEAEEALNIASKVGRQIVSEKSKDIPSYASGSNAQTKSHALSALIDAYIKLGRLRGAELAAAAIDHPQYRAIAMSNIAVAYSNIGERSKALSILRKAQSIAETSKYYAHDSPREYGLFTVVSALAEAGFGGEANNAFTRFLTLIEKEESGDHFAGELFVLTRLFESCGISPTGRVDALFRQLLAQQNGDN